MNNNTDGYNILGMLVKGIREVDLVWCNCPIYDDNCYCCKRKKELKKDIND
jgi:hypothetical protein